MHVQWNHLIKTPAGSALCVVFLCATEPGLTLVIAYVHVVSCDFIAIRNVQDRSGVLVGPVK